ncbi:MAG: hypothetical protein AAF743_16490, partial [Planctomycetota bacterium]
MLHVPELLEPRRLLAVAPFALGGDGFDGEAIVKDAGDGGTIVAGLFSGTTDFAPGAEQVTRTARGDTDIFVAKYDAAGDLLWVNQFGGGNREDQFESQEDRDQVIAPFRLGLSPTRVSATAIGAGEYVTDLAVDADGNIFAVGTFVGTGTYGDFVLRTPRGDFYDALMLKIDTDGNLIFARQWGGEFDDAALSVGLDPKGNPYVGGYFSRIADFNPNGGSNPSTLRNGGGPAFNLEADGRDDAFVALFSAGAGNLAWVGQFGGDGFESDERDAVNDIAVDEIGNVYAGGTFSGSADFNPNPNSRFVVRGGDETDMFTMLLSVNQKLVWVATQGGDDRDGIGAVALAPGGGVYSVGYFEERADVIPGDDEFFFRAAEGNGIDDADTDLVLNRFAEDGTLLWTKQMGGPGFETIGDLTTNASGEPILTGGFFGTADFDPSPGRFTLSSTRGNDNNLGDDDNNTGDRDENSYDAFVVRLDVDGRFGG